MPEPVSTASAQESCTLLPSTAPMAGTRPAGVGGFVKSTRKQLVVPAPTLPTASTAFTTTQCAPPVRSAVGVKVVALVGTDVPASMITWYEASPEPVSSPADHCTTGRATPTQVPSAGALIVT